MIREISLKQLEPKKFIDEKVHEISSLVGNEYAVNALSGGVDSSVVTMLAHRALGDNLLTYFIDNGIMREGEPQYIITLFRKLGVRVELIDAREVFFGRLAGLTDPEEKREAITQAFYKDVFGKVVRESDARFLFHGTNYTDVEETVAGVKRQHNILEQLGIDTQKIYGYRVVEPLLQLRKQGVRKIGRALGLPREIWNRPPFPGPALAARIIGEVTPERVAIVRKATAIVEKELRNTRAFQYLAILHDDMVTGVRGGKRDFGHQIEIRCWNSKDAVIASPTGLPFKTLERLAEKMTREVPGVVSVTYNITRKPPSTIEAV